MSGSLVVRAPHTRSIFVASVHAEGRPIQGGFRGGLHRIGDDHADASIHADRGGGGVRYPRVSPSAFIRM